MTIDYEITISQQDCLALRGALQDTQATRSAIRRMMEQL